MNLRLSGSTPTVRRLPDFVLIGTMKSGTTALFRQLAELPGVELPEVKEPHFFARDDRWQRGIAWYSELFAAYPSSCRTGEASVSYTRAPYSSVAAERLMSVIPDARLICLLRDPEERMRSHFRHEVQHGRERRTLGQALAAGDRDYLASSQYATCLAPWLAATAAGQLLIERFEDIHSPVDDAAWRRVLAHIGVGTEDRSKVDTNSSESKRSYSPFMRWLYEAGATKRLESLPRPIRRIGRKILFRSETGAVKEQLDSSRQAIPSWVSDILRDDGDELRRITGNGRLRWGNDGGA